MIDHSRLLVTGCMVIAACLVAKGTVAQPTNRQIQIEERSQSKEQVAPGDTDRNQPPGGGPASASPDAAPQAAPQGAPTPNVAPTAGPEGPPQGAPQVAPTAGPEGPPQGSPQVAPTAGPEGPPQGAPQLAPAAGPEGPPQGAPQVAPAAGPEGPPQGAPGPQRAADCAGHKFLTSEWMVAAMAADLDRMKSRARGTRYLTLTHFANICARDEAMDIYRQGTIKLVNSLSRSPDVAHIEAIDPERTILRINIDDLGWDASDWDNLIAAYPYAVRPDTQLFSVLQSATETKLPYVRADWFANTASRPPLYTALLKLGHNVHALAKDQGVDIEGDIRRFVAQRAGFQKSGESRNNRVIERHASHSGYFWLTYDFAGNRARQSIFDFPLGPGGNNGFNPDGGAVIFSLPNGFQAYFEADAKGEEMDLANTAMIQNPSRHDPEVVLGISCMGCHNQGVRPMKDEVRDSVLSERAFSRDMRDAVDGLYPPYDRMKKMMDDDAYRYSQAMSRAGLDPAANLDGVEPINALSDRYDAFLGTAQAAAELDMPADAFNAAVDDSSRRFRSMQMRLGQDNVSRGEFEGRYAEMIKSLTDETMIQLDRPRPVVDKPAMDKPVMAPPPVREKPHDVHPPVYHAPNGRERQPNYYR